MSTNFKFAFIDSLQSVDAARWDALCPDDYPFVRHSFLSALEESGSVSQEQGWQPQHLLIEEGDVLIAAVPLYIKSHSYGEYVFDWAWADAYKRYGLNYYPKLISAIPFTPCSGIRILIADAEKQSALILLIVTAIKKRAQELNASSWHCLFITKDISEQLLASATVQRIGCQFHWFNRSYKSWDDFVATMTSRKRKNINKERSKVNEQGITFLTKEAADINPDDWKLFYQLYCNTYLKRSGHNGYLTEQFFNLIGKNFSSAVVMVIAQHENKSIAAALFFKDNITLYGRYWGCLEEYDFLHFETCYYQGINYAIKKGLQRFDGGAQGEHKIQRGFEPIITYSNHWLMRDDFQQAISNFVDQEAEGVQAYSADAKNNLPFKEV
ncbi:MAG: GNAT family N-acetyltransferase [Pseudomonadota bacterium]